MSLILKKCRNFVIWGQLKSAIFSILCRFMSFPASRILDLSIFVTFVDWLIVTLLFFLFFSFVLLLLFNRWWWSLMLDWIHCFFIKFGKLVDIQNWQLHWIWFAENAIRYILHRSLCSANILTKYNERMIF